MRVMTKRLAAYALICALAPALAGCGGGGGAGGGGSEPSFSSGGKLAIAVGCTDFEEDGGMILASGGGSCTTDVGDDVALNIFKTNDNRDSFMKLGVANGGHYAYGDGWNVECTTQAAMKRVAAKIQGSSTQD